MPLAPEPPVHPAPVSLARQRASLSKSEAAASGCWRRDPGFVLPFPGREGPLRNGPVTQAPGQGSCRDSRHQPGFCPSFQVVTSGHWELLLRVRSWAPSSASCWVHFLKVGGSFLGVPLPPAW